MQHIYILNKKPKILKKINYYLEPLVINNKFKLSLIKKDKDSNIYYALMYTLYPIYINNFIELSKLITPKEAYNILMIISLIKKNREIDNETKLKMINYNYTWCKLLLYYNLDLNTIKNLLNNYLDFHYIELIFINNNINNIVQSFNIMNEYKDYYNTIKNKQHYYYLRKYNIPHLDAYVLSKYDDESIMKMVQLINCGFNELKYLLMVNNLTVNQIDFLKLSRLGYIDNAEFNNIKFSIFDNAINQILII
jgi:hypothetical protein